MFIGPVHADVLTGTPRVLFVPGGRRLRSPPPTGSAHSPAGKEQLLRDSCAQQCNQTFTYAGTITGARLSQCKMSIERQTNLKASGGVKKAQLPVSSA